MSVPPEGPRPPAYRPGELKALAHRYGLSRVGARPSTGAYIRSLWQRRHFIWAMASASAYARNQNNYLGQAWAVLNPLVLAAVYYLVFGVLLGTTGGVENYTGFLIIGIFSFQYLAASLTSGSNSVLSNINLVRAIQFPRAVLPISTALAELLALLPSIAAMILIVLVTGERPSVNWLLLPLAMVVMLVFNTGASMVAARIVVGARDLRNLIPVAVRLLRYVSGVFFSIEHYAGGELGLVLQYQPFAVYLTMMRSSLLGEFRPDASIWAAGVGWALLAIIIGFFIFWRAEERYGRD